MKYKYKVNSNGQKQYFVEFNQNDLDTFFTEIGRALTKLDVGFLGVSPIRAESDDVVANEKISLDSNDISPVYSDITSIIAKVRGNQPRLQTERPAGVLRPRTSAQPVVPKPDIEL